MVELDIVRDGVISDFTVDDVIIVDDGLDSFTTPNKKRNIITMYSIKLIQSNRS